MFCFCHQQEEKAHEAGPAPAFFLFKESWSSFLFPGSRCPADTLFCTKCHINKGGLNKRSSIEVQAAPSAFQRALKRFHGWCFKYARFCVHISIFTNVLLSAKCHIICSVLVMASAGYSPHYLPWSGTPDAGWCLAQMTECVCLRVCFSSVKNNQ